MDASISTNATPNQTEFTAWIKARIHLSFGLKDDEYIARMLDVAKYTLADLQDLKLTKYDPKDHEQNPGDRQPLYYYVLRIPACRHRAKIADDLPPSPQRANQALNLPAIEHVMIAHTSNPGGACGILKEAKIAPSRLHVSDSNSVCMAWGTAVAVKEGGEQACCDLTKEGGTVHHQRAKMWVTNTNSHILTAIAFPVTALPPTRHSEMKFCVVLVWLIWRCPVELFSFDIFKPQFLLVKDTHDRETPRTESPRFNSMVQCMSSNRRFL